ncbi:Ankyrin repeat-containing domain protein [Apiospora sp. TS-2023a]
MGESWWDDFSNNLATDLAPFLALLGESPTKQYLSECITPEDIVIFALAPLGVITAVVSAIRICGTPSLRAFVGRAQEGAGVAEAELCSSTSRDVCEVFSNGGIARIFGRPKILEIVHDPQASSDEFFPSRQGTATAGIHSFPDYVETERGKEEWEELSTQKEKAEKYSDPEPGKQGSVPPKSVRFAPNPNLSLNIGIKPLHRLWFLAAAALGIMLQLSVLVWAALTRYHYRWLKDSREDDYAVILTAVGTFSLCFGMGLCAHLIESKTKECAFKRKHIPGKSTRIYWVQPGNQRVGDQIFDSFAYCDGKSPLQRYMTSWKDTEREPSGKTVIWAAVATTVIGFICQFLGLRACHSSVAVVQLGATVTMSLVRAGLRTQRLEKEDNLLANDPDLFQGRELDFLAMTIGRPQSESGRIKTQTAEETSEAQMRFKWVVSSSQPSSRCNTEVTNTGGKGRDNFNVLELLPTACRDSPTLYGFGIKNPLASTGNHLPNFTDELAAAADKELLQWSSEFYNKQDLRCGPADGGAKARLNDAAKTMHYRARLARMTGCDDPESEQSSHWGERFIPMRKTVRTLARAIEDTMDILFKTGLLVMHESWDKASSIFWTLSCSSLESLDIEACRSDIFLSLRRRTDASGMPVRGYKGWKADKSELEAVLRLWLWSLRADLCENAEKEQRISRIISTYSNTEHASNDMLDFEIWQKRGGIQIQQQRLKVRSLEDEPAIRSSQVQDSVWWRDGEEFHTREQGEVPCHASDKRRFFGWCNTGAAATLPHGELNVL